MDLELIVRAIWRRKGQLAIWILLGAVAVPLGASFLLSKKYSSETDIAVFPRTNDSSASSTYSLQPDRYVDTQIAVINSPAAAAKVANQLKIPVSTVTNAVTVEQVEKSDVVRLLVSDTDAGRSARIASELARNYVDNVRAEAASDYADSLASVNDQLASLSSQSAELNSKIATAGVNPGANGPLQNQLDSITSQTNDLMTLHDKLLVESKTLPNNTTIVSQAKVSSVPTGPGKAKLAMYGAALGFGIGAVVIAIRTAPGKTLEDLELLDEIDGIPVLGVTPQAHRWSVPWKSAQQTERQDFRRLRIAKRLQSQIDKDGPLAVIPLGSSRSVAGAMSRVGLFMTDASEEGTPVNGHGRSEPPAKRLAIGMDWYPSLSSFVQRGNDDDRSSVVVAVQITHVSTNDLIDAAETLTSIGAEVVGVIGVG